MHHAHPTRPARLVGAVAVSLAGHALVLTVAAFLLPCPGSDASVRGDYGVVSVVPVAAPPPEAPEPPEPPPARHHVALPAPEQERRPEHAEYADRFDRTVERETTAREIGGAPMTHVASQDAAGRGTPEVDGERTVASAVPERRDRERGPTPTEEGPDGTGSAAPLPTDVDPTAEPTEGEGVTDAPSPRGTGLDLTLFGANASDPIVVRGGREELLELEEGDRTLVNSQRSLYWSFFERLRRQVEIEWDPLLVYRRNDPSGQLYRRIDRYTVVDMTLQSDGALRDAVVSRASGLDFLDEEAMRAIQAASPYPNVPEGLKDEDGLVRIRFSFLLTFDGTMRIRRLPL